MTRRRSRPFSGLFTTSTRSHRSRRRALRGRVRTLEVLESRNLLSTLVVDQTSGPYYTIGAAVSAARPSDTIEVDAGTYNEEVTINEPLTLVATSNDNVNPNTSTRGPESIVDGKSGSTAFYVAANDVTINGFTVEGATVSNNVGAGIYLKPGFHGSQIENNIIQNNIVGLFVANNSLTDQTVVEDNLFRNNNEPGSTSDNDIYADQYTAGKGMENVLIQDNTFTNSSYDRSSAGIDFSNTDPTTPFIDISLQDNTFTNSGSGMYFLGTQNATVTGNTISGAAEVGIALLGGHNAVSNEEITITGNTMTDGSNPGTGVGLFNLAAPGNAYSGTLTLTDNAFNVSGGSIINETAAPIDATTGNTFNSLSPSIGGLSDDYAIQNTITDALNVEGYGLVRIVAGNVYVTQANETTTPGAIQRGIDAASSGDTVNVQGGSTDYFANSTEMPGGLYISVPLTLLGAQAGVDPRSGRSGPETTIVPGVSDPDPYDSTEVRIIYVDSSNVTIDGFTVDGDNPALTSTVTFNGAQIGAAEGIASFTGVGNITVRDNIIKDTTYTGIDFYNYGNDSATDDNTITQNLIENLGGGGYDYGVGILLYNNFYANVTQNKIDDVMVGVQIGNFSNADPGDPATTANIADNTISTYSVGVFYSLMYGSSSPFTVQDNAITAVNDPTDGGSDWTGFLITSLRDDVSVSFIGNMVDGSAATSYTTVEGDTVWNTPTTGAVTISGGSVSGVDTGLWVNNYEGYESAASGSTLVTVDGVAITASGIGVYVQDDPRSLTPPATTDPSVWATIEGDTTISGTGAVGIEVSGSQASLAFSGALPASLDSGLAQYIVLADGALGGVTPIAFDASQVSFGGFVGATGTLPADLSTYYGIEDKISDYLDLPTLGYVSLNSTNVFITDSSEMANAGAIQRGINVTTSGGTVNVQAGTFAGGIAIGSSLALTGAGVASTTIQGEISIGSGDAVSISGVTVDPTTASAGMTVNGGSLTATGIAVTGFSTGILIENNASADVTDSAITGNSTGVLVGSGAGDTSLVTVQDDDISGNATAGVTNNQTGASYAVTATYDWWGSDSGPYDPVNNPSGSGTIVSTNVIYSPWQGTNGNINAPNNLDFGGVPGATSEDYVITPSGGELRVTLNSALVGTIPAGATATFNSNAATDQITLYGPTGIADSFGVNDTSITMSDTTFSGTVLNFSGFSDRELHGEGTANTFDILAAGTSGPTGTLWGNTTTNTFVFTGSHAVRGNITGSGSTTLDYSAYSTGVTVILATQAATGVSQTVSGITAVIGSAYNDSLTGNGTGVALTGGQGTNIISGSGSDYVVESGSTNYTLTNTQLTGTSPAFTDNLSGIVNAKLTGNASGNTFNVSGWTHSARLVGGAGANTVVASKGSSTTFVVTNSSLSSNDGMSLTLSNITEANLTSSSGTFTVGGWSGSGTLSGKTVNATKSGGTFTLTNASLATGDGMNLTLSGLTVANLTDSAGGSTFTVGAWTGAGSLTAPAASTDAVAATKSASYTLTNSSLVASPMSLTLTNIATANLTDTGGSHTFTVGSWTGTGTFTDTSATADTLDVNKSANISLVASGPGFTLTSPGTDSMSITLGSSFATANLNDTGGGNTITAKGFSGAGSFKDTGSTPDVLRFTGNGNMTLTPTLLTVTGTPTRSDTLANFANANLTDTGGGHTFTVSAWTGSGSLSDTATNADTVVASKVGSYALSNTALSIGSMTLVLTNVATANLTDTTAGGTFTVSGWTGGGTLMGSSARVVSTKNASYTLATRATTTLGSSDGMNLTLASSTLVPVLTDTGGGNTFTITSWTGTTATLTGPSGGGDAVTVNRSASITLANGSAKYGSTTLTLSKITTANLVDSAGYETFNVSGWTGTGSITNTSGNPDTVVATKTSQNITLSDSAITSTDGMNLTLSGITSATLTVAGSGASIVNATRFSGLASLTAAGSVSATLLGGTHSNTLTTTSSGDGILVGNGAANTLTDTGSGRNILIGAGAGGSTITGNGNDILVSGATAYDSNLAALDAILAEWDSTDSYSTKIRDIMNGSHLASGYSLGKPTSSNITQDTNANTLKDGSSSTQNNWFLSWPRDSVTKKSNETKTIL